MTIHNPRDLLFLTQEGSTVVVKEKDLRGVAKLLARHLGEISTIDSPIGVILPGNGLTDTQLQNPSAIDAQRLLKAAADIAVAADWRNSAEGAEFWRAIVLRLEDLAAAINAENQRLEDLKPTSVWGITVKSEPFSDGNPGVVLDTGSGVKKLDREAARTLADALVKHASQT